MSLRALPLALVLAFVSMSPRVFAQTMVTYHLHDETSAVNNVKQLKTAAPDVAAVVRSSGELNA